MADYYTAWNWKFSSCKHNISLHWSTRANYIWHHTAGGLQRSINSNELERHLYYSIAFNIDDFQDFNFSRVKNFFLLTNVFVFFSLCRFFYLVYLVLFSEIFADVIDVFNHRFVYFSNLQKKIYKNFVKEFYKNCRIKTFIWFWKFEFKISVR